MAAPLILENSLLNFHHYRDAAETGRIEVDVEHKKADATFLKHDLGMGLQIGVRDKLAVDALVRGSYALKGRWGGSNLKNGVLGTAGYGFEGRLRILDQAEIFYRQDREYGSDGSSSRIESYGIETPKLFSAEAFTGYDKAKASKPRKIFGGIQRDIETDFVPKTDGTTAPTKVKVWIFNVGGRF